MDNKRKHLPVKASDFGKTHEDLLKSFIQKNTPDTIQRLQKRSNDTLKEIVKKKRISEKDIIKNDVKIKNTNGGEFGFIDEVSKDGIGKVKAVSAADFENIIMNKAKSVDQSELNALMHNSKIKKGYLHYINQDNPYMQKTIHQKYDFDKYQNDLSKVKRVQSFIEKKALPIFNNSDQKFSALNHADFAGDYSRLQEIKSQSIVHAGIKSNNPFIRNMRREARPIIEGMGHGWFGKMRKMATAFGSPFRLGDFSDILKLTSGDIDNAFDDQYGVDIETKSLKSSKHSMFQVSLKRGNDYHSIFMQQPNNFKLENHPFLYDQTAIGKLHKEKNFDFTKIQKVDDYSKQLSNTQEGFAGNVVAEVAKRRSVQGYVHGFLEDAKKNKKNILAMNANFEIDHFEELFDGRSPVRYSQEYMQLRSEQSMQRKSILGKVKRGEITEEEGFNRLVSNQKIRATQILNEALDSKGSIIEIQELSKTLNAMAQQKNLIAKTSRFGVGTNINFLARSFLGEKEWHDGNLDNFQQGRLSKMLVNAMKEVEGGGELSKATDSWLKMRQAEEPALYRESMAKMIKGNIEAGESLGKINPKYNKENLIFTDDIANSQKLYDEELLKYKNSDEGMTFLRSNKAIPDITDAQTKALKTAKMGTMLFGAVMLGSAMTNLFKFSGSDDEANTIEGLQHGSPTQNQRKYNTSFGSGFRTQDFHKPEDPQKDPMSWTQIGLTGLGTVGAYSVFKHQASKRRLNDVKYIGALSPLVDNEKLLNRTHSTAQDLLVSTIRRVEASLGGFPKAFGAGDLFSYGMYDTARFEVDFKTQQGESYAKYMDKAFNRKFREEGIHKVVFENGKLMLHRGDKIEEMKGSFSLMKTVTDNNQSKSMSSIARSHLSQLGLKNVQQMSKFDFLITNGVDHFASAFIHETVSKPMKLMSNPFEALTDVIPELDDYFTPWMKKTLGPDGFIAKFLNTGASGSELATNWQGMLKSHGGKLAGVGALAYFGLGTLNWGAEKIAPDGTPIGDAGLIGGAAYSVRKAHETYARLSDITGLTGFRDYIESKAPGSEGWQSTIGLTLAGGMAGGLWGSVQGLALESSATDKYGQFLKNAEKTESFDGILGKIFKKNVTKTGKAIRTGGAIGFALALPFTLAGFGADKSASELGLEYSGEKEVAVKKGRFWESSFTPWEGSEVDYYRPNWYAKLIDDSKNEELYGGNISPFTKLGRSIYDPFWLEKNRYFDQPYPLTGPDGSMLGIFGPAYEASLGRIIKPVATMHESELPEGFLDNTEYDIDALARKQWNSALEFMGLRGFAVKAIKETITGSGEIFSDPNEVRSAKDIDSMTRDFYDLQLGGGILTTEALRRVFQNQDGFQKAQMDATINLNPLKNMMPSWMPGSDFYQDFQHGDPFLKVKDGYSRLPGEGFAQRYEELKGMDPNDYPDIFKYKILSDVAYGSMEHRNIKGKLQNRELTQYEQDIFDDVQRQVDEKKKSELNARDPSTYDSFLGRYSAVLTDLARSNPLETLLPVSPAHKFLAPPDIEDVLEEQRYSKDYRNWANPIDDFIMPTVSMTLNSMGLGGIDMSSDQAEIADYFDKTDYMKFTNLARDAQSKGDLKSADRYTIMAQKTYTGKDLYSHPSDVVKSLPKNERASYKYFIKTDRATQVKMIGRVNPRHRDAYQAQMDNQIRQEAMKSQSMSSQQRKKVMKDVEARQRAIQARRSAELQDYQSRMPGNDWVGWSPAVSVDSAQNRYLENAARDTHAYTGRRSAREGDLSQVAAATVNIPASSSSDYASHYSSLSASGVENALVVMRPGLDNSPDLDITLDRRSERNDALREWGYVV